MTTNIMLRSLLAVAIAANSISPACAAAMVVPKLAPGVSPSVGAAGAAGIAAGGMRLHNTTLSPSLSASLPTLGNSLARPQNLNSEVAVKPRALRHTAVQDVNGRVAPSKHQGSLGQGTPYKAAAGKSETVRHTVAAVHQGRGGKINAAALGSLFEQSVGRRGVVNAADNLDVDAAGDAVFAAEAAADVVPTVEEDALDLWVGKTAQKGIFDSKISASIRPINNTRSEWFWGQYQKKLPIRVVSGGRVLFITRIVKAGTKKIKALTLDDFRAYYGARSIAKRAGENDAKQLARLRRKLLEEIKWKSQRKINAPKVISEETKVRVLNFLPYNQARELPENGIEKTPEIRARKELAVPAELKDLQRMLPRLVLFDLRLYGDRIPFDVLEDMGKLQKAGVTFVFLSDKTQDEVEKMIRRDTPAQQQNEITRWKLLSLSNDGNTLYGFSGSFEELKASRKFAADEREMLKYAAQAAAPEGIIVEDRGYVLSLRPKRGVAISALKKSMQRQLDRFGMPDGSYALTVGEHEGSPVVRVRPTTLSRSFGRLIKDLQVEEGLYLNEQNILTVSDDAELHAALPNAMHAGPVMPQATAREDYIETALAAMLGSYRHNRQGDLAASASSIKSFKFKRFGGGGFDYRIYMLMGHVAHTALDWAIMKYNQAGELPPYEELIAKSREIWEKEQIGVTTNLLEKSRERTLGYRDSMEARMFTMYQELERTLKIYPIALGTELPNLMVLDRYNASGEQTHRDIFRGLYDLVLARKVEGGLDVLVADFKSGQTPALQHMAKDTQVLLYDYFSKVMWPTITVPYSLAHKLQKVVSRYVGFLYPRGMQGVTITEFDRLFFEKFLFNIMNRMRKHKRVLTEDMIAAETKKAEREARQAAKQSAAEKKTPAKKK
ncbi:MAG: hypothetical protein ABIJ96_01315 [Elusimicrobiota bacterium]